MKKRIWGICLLGMLLMLSACAGDGAPAATESSGEQNLITMEVETETAEYLLADGKTVGVYYQYGKPVVTISQNPAAADVINADAEQMKANFINGEMEGEIFRDEMLVWAQDHFDAMQEYSKDSSDFPSYSMESEVTPGIMAEPIISLVYQSYVYSGGAHGMPWREGANYDAETGEKLTLQMIAAEPETFTAFCAEKIEEISKGEPYAEEDMFFPDYANSIPDIIVDGSWYVSETGVVFIANPYLLAPYAAGIIEFTIPWEDLQETVKPEYLP